MAEIFGSTGGPSWKDPSEELRKSERLGYETSESFSRGFLTQYSKTEERRFQQQKIDEMRDKLKPVIDELGKAKSWEESMDTVRKHPEWLMDPELGPYVRKGVEVWDQSERIKNQAENSIIQRRNMETMQQWKNAEVELSPEAQKAKEDMIRNGTWYAPTPDGKGSNFNAPSAGAQEIIRQDRANRGLMPIGDKAMQDAWREEQKRKGQMQLEGKKIEGRTAVEEKKAEGRVSVEEAKGERQKAAIAEKYGFMMDLEKLRGANMVESAKAKSEANLKAAKELEEIKSNNRTRENSELYSAPKTVTLPDGSVVVTYGKQLRTIPRAKVESNPLLKSRLREVDKEIDQLQKMAIASPKNEEIRGRLLDAQMHRVNLFHDHGARPATPAEVKGSGLEQAQPEPDDDSGSETPAAPNVDRFKIIEVK